MSCRPVSQTLADLTERFAEALDRDPRHVFGTMNRRALERPRASAARTFAGALVEARSPLVLVLPTGAAHRRTRQ